MDSEIQKVVDESENMGENQDVVQEGGAICSGEVNLGSCINGRNSQVVVSSLLQVPFADLKYAKDFYNNVKRDYILNDGFTINGTNYEDRPLLLSDLWSLISNDSSITGRKTIIQSLFDNIPLAQYKHLPDPSYLHATASGGAMDESTLPSEESQEVSLPTEPSQESEEQLPSLDIVEPSSTGGSYKWSSHKKRKSTRIRTKKNKSKK